MSPSCQLALTLAVGSISFCLLVIPCLALFDIAHVYIFTLTPLVFIDLHIAHHLWFLVRHLHLILDA
jgi:hypothetical protein